MQKWPLKLLHLVVAIAMMLSLFSFTAVPAKAAKIGDLVPSEDWNVLTSAATFKTPTGAGVTTAPWQVNTYDALAGSTVATLAGGAAGDNFITVVSSGVVSATIIAITAAGTYEGTKKWGKIDATILTPNSGSTLITWNENLKLWEGSKEFSEVVIGSFWVQTIPGTLGWFERPAEGATIHWWLVPANVDITGVDRWDSAAQLVTDISNLPKAKNTSFTPGGVPIPVAPGYAPVTHVIDTDTGLKTTRTIYPFLEEAVWIIVLAEYPTRFPAPQELVRPEFSTWAFWTQQMEKVPTVSWAGEKVVLEKKFGINYAGLPAQFALQGNSPGSLEPAGPILGPPITIGFNDSRTVWTRVNSEGVAQCILVSEQPGEADINLAVFAPRPPATPPVGATAKQVQITEWFPINQHGFVVFFLKLEEIKLTNVLGNREYHNGGKWLPPNPWDVTKDVLTEKINVSQDALLRVRIKGWFMGDNLSARDTLVRDMDPTNPGIYMERLPAGRWVLPDDWPILAGPQWQDFRPRWDLMDNPFDDIMSNWGKVIARPGAPGLVDKVYSPEEWGPYLDKEGHGKVIAPWPVIGPFMTLENYGPLPVVPADGKVVGGLRKTVVPNGLLEWWDAPMPAAKIMFEVVSGPGYFKEADKGGIYYIFHKSGLYADSGEVTLEKHIHFTNPYYEQEIPASFKIPPFVNNGGNDWDSWGWSSTQGPYEFWTIFNRPPSAPANDPSNNQDPAHPTKVEVYSDNHGEAMVYLNGVWNLNLEKYFKGVKVDGAELMQIDMGTLVGTTTIKAKADYPYFRKHSPLVSNTVTKQWTFDKDIDKWVEQIKYEPGQIQQIFVKRIWVVVSNQDHTMAVEHQVWDPVGKKFTTVANPTLGPQAALASLAQPYTRLSPFETIKWVIDGPVGIFDDVDAPPESIFTDQGKPAALSTTRKATDAENAKLSQVGKLGKTLIETVKVAAKNQAVSEEPENRYIYHRYDVATAVIESSLGAKTDVFIRVFEPLLVLRDGKNIVVSTVIVHDRIVDFAIEETYDPVITNLKPRWNLVALMPDGWIDGQTASVANFWSAQPTITSVWTYDKVQQKWLGASRNVPAWANNLQQVEYGKGYFMYNLQ